VKLARGWRVRPPPMARTTARTTTRTTTTCAVRGRCSRQTMDVTLAPAPRAGSRARLVAPGCAALRRPSGRASACPSSSTRKARLIRPCVPPCPRRRRCQHLHVPRERLEGGREVHSAPLPPLSSYVPARRITVFAHSRLLQLFNDGLSRGCGTDRCGVTGHRLL